MGSVGVRKLSEVAKPGATWSAQNPSGVQLESQFHVHSNVDARMQCGSSVLRVHDDAMLEQLLLSHSLLLLLQDA